MAELQGQRGPRGRELKGLGVNMKCIHLLKSLIGVCGIWVSPRSIRMVAKWTSRRPTMADRQMFLPRPEKYLVVLRNTDTLSEVFLIHCIARSLSTSNRLK